MGKNKSSVGYMVHLDGIRAFAVGGVILEHWGSGLPGALPAIVGSLDLGGLGVECFFVLSGFLIIAVVLELMDLLSLAYEQTERWALLKNLITGPLWYTYVIGRGVLLCLERIPDYLDPAGQQG